MTLASPNVSGTSSNPANTTGTIYQDGGTLTVNGDLDILGADSDLSWFENTDGLGTFGPARAIATDVDGASFVWAGNVDGDDDHRWQRSSVGWQ